jgi:Dolichyl-phosphate-mannose-protein mannosyltransferase
MALDERMRLEADGSQNNSPLKTNDEPNSWTILGCFAAFVAAWGAYLAITNAPVSIHHDMSEAYMWGREFQLGYNQHPPFWAWVCGLWFLLLPRAGWSFALLCSINAGVGLCGSWRLIGDFAAGKKRQTALILLLVTPFYTFLSYKYNANLIFLSIWPWMAHFFVRSLERRTLAESILFGMVAGFALMSKYYALILVATCFIAALQHPARSRYFASAAPYVAVAVAAAVCAPHLWWLIANRAPPLRYLASVSGQDWSFLISHAADTIFGALWMNLAVFIAVAYASRAQPREWLRSLRRQRRKPRFRLLATLALAPLILTVAAAFALRTRISPEMILGIFPLTPLLLLEVSGAGNIDRLYRIGSRLAVAVSLAALVLSPAIALTKTYWTANSKKADPYQEVALAATSLWRERTSLPLAYVAGSDWYENALAFYSPEHPHGFVHFDYALNLWVTPELIAKNGLLSVCRKEDSDCLASTASFITPQSTQTPIALARKFWGHVARTVDFVVTIIPPRA